MKKILAMLLTGVMIIGTLSGLSLIHISEPTRRS